MPAAKHQPTYEQVAGVPFKRTHTHAQNIWEVVYIVCAQPALCAATSMRVYVCMCMGVCNIHVRPFETLLMLKADLYVNNNFQLGLKSKRLLPDEKWKCSQLFCWVLLLDKVKQIEKHKQKEMCSVPRNNINIRLSLRLLRLTYSECVGIRVVLKCRKKFLKWK